MRIKSSKKMLFGVLFVFLLILFSYQFYKSEQKFIIRDSVTLKPIPSVTIISEKLHCIFDNCQLKRNVQVSDENGEFSLPDFSVIYFFKKGYIPGSTIVFEDNSVLLKKYATFQEFEEEVPRSLVIVSEFSSLVRERVNGSIQAMRTFGYCPSEDINLEDLCKVTKKAKSNLENCIRILGTIKTITGTINRESDIMLNCVFELALNNNDPKICLEAKSFDYARRCLNNLAQGRGNVEACSYLNESGDKNNCLSMAGITREDSNTCNQITDYIEQGACIFHIASNTNNLNICKEIRDDGMKILCEMYFINYDEKKCDLISNSYYRHYCKNKYS